MEKKRIKRLPVLAGGKGCRNDCAGRLRAGAGLVRSSAVRGGFYDHEIKRRIQQELDAQLWAPTASIDVVVKNGDVDLSGVLTDGRERNALHALVENVEGVRELHDHITWVEPYSGMLSQSPEETTKGNVG